MTFIRVRQASEIIGSSVMNTSAEESGSIKDLMVDLYSGRIAHAVPTFGGIMMMGNILFASLLDTLIPATDRNGLTQKIYKFSLPWLKALIRTINPITLNVKPGG